MIRMRRIPDASIDSEGGRDDRGSKKQCRESPPRGAISLRARHCRTLRVREWYSIPLDRPLNVSPPGRTALF